MIRHLSASAVTALRWGSVAYALAVLGPYGADVGWTDVVILAVCVFLTTLRTLLPLDLGDESRWQRATALFDVAVFAVAVGWSAGSDSPWLFSLLVAVSVAAFGWGNRMAILAASTAVIGTTLATAASGASIAALADDPGDLTAVTMFAAAAAAGVFIRSRLVEAAGIARRTTGDLANLAAANVLLSELTGVALTLPGAFTLRDGLERIRGQLRTFLSPRTIALLTLDEHNEEWTPKITDRCAMRAAYRSDDLPEPLSAVLETGSAVSRDSGRVQIDRSDAGAVPSKPSWIADGSASGVYLPLRTRGRIIGLLGLEHEEPGHFDDVDIVLRDGLADVIALTIDNARWFGRLRSLGAEEERIRVARDIHDRLGQWMTYIKLELERISGAESVDRAELVRLHDDASEALDELRETLRQLRTGVSDDRPLASLGADLVNRFGERTGTAARFRVLDPDQRLPVPVENELFRILQEALNNVDRHAAAKTVDVDWNVEGGNFALVVTDDGCGFDPERTVREQSYGVVGMRERAEVIGASLQIESTPGRGTRLVVGAGRIAAHDQLSAQSAAT